MTNKLESVTHAESFFNDLDFRKMFFKVFYYKWLILGFTTLTFLLGFIYTLNIEPKYTSSALIQVDNQLGSANNMQQMLGNLGSTFAANLQVAPADIEIALIKSRFILQSVIENLKLNLSVSPNYFPFIGYRIARMQGAVLAKPWLNLSQYAWGGEEIILDKLSLPEDLTDERLYIKTEEKGKYSIYTADNRLLLTGQVGKISLAKDEDGHFIKVLISKLKANVGTFFKVKLKHNEDVLRELSLGLAINDLGEKSKTKTGVLQLNFQGHNPIYISNVLNQIIDFAIQRNIEKKSAEASKTLEFLNRQLPTVHKSLQDAETDLNVYRAKKGTIDISQEAKNVLMQLSTLEQTIAELKLKKVEMLQELTPQHPYVISISRKQEQLQREVRNFEKKIKSLPLTDQEALSLERDVKVKNQLYLLLLNKIQQLEVLKAGTLSDIRVLSRATIPINPLPDHKYFILFASILFGFILSLAIIFIRDLFKRAVCSVESIEERLQIPNFAIVPYSSAQKTFLREMKKQSKRRQNYVLAQCALHDIAIEGIRGLRTVLQHELKNATNNIVSIIGASPNIGKSFVSINLAQVFVDSGKKVLVIDCDMRRGRMHQFFNLKKSPGFSNLLNHQSNLTDVIKLVGNTLHFIPAGDYPKNPSELLLMSPLENLLAQFNKEYEVIIIDTPPVLAVTDAIILAKFSGTNLMVVGQGKDQIEELELTVKRVTKNGLKIQGLIFNNTHEMKGEFRQYNYYYAYDNAN